MPETEPRTTTGRIGPWYWAEYWSDEVTAADIVVSLRHRIVGLRAICTSWDSCMLKLEGPYWAGWAVEGGHAVSPPIGTGLLEAWPQSGCGYDEWYFFKAPPSPTKLHAFCNWCGM